MLVSTNQQQRLIVPNLPFLLLLLEHAELLPPERLLAQLPERQLHLLAVVVVKEMFCLVRDQLVFALEHIPLLFLLHTERSIYLDTFR